MKSIEKYDGLYEKLSHSKSNLDIVVFKFSRVIFIFLKVPFLLPIVNC